MKTLVNLWLFLFALWACGQSTNAVRQVALDPLCAMPIPVGTGSVTTVRFPSAIAGLDAAFVATNAASLFQLSFHPGAAFFSLRALSPSATANINVIWENQTYVLQLEESANPALSVIFTRGQSRVTNLQRETACLEQAKTLALLKAKDRKAAITPFYRYFHSPWSSRDLEVITEEAFQFEHVVVFHLLLQNHLTTPFYYMPLGFAVENNGHYFHPTCGDGTGVVPPETTVSVFVALPAAPPFTIQQPVQVICSLLGPTNSVAPQTVSMPQ